MNWDSVIPNESLLIYQQAARKSGMKFDILGSGSDEIWYQYPGCKAARIPEDYVAIRVSGWQLLFDQTSEPFLAQVLCPKDSHRAEEK